MSASVVAQPEADAHGAARELPAKRPWRQAHGRAAPCRRSRPRRTTRATPSRSKAITGVSAFMPGTANSVVLGSRSASAPKITACGATAREPGFEPVRAAPACAAASSARWSEAAAAAAPKPAIAATFSVPARMPRSCPPPRISGSAR